jgi:hypothetical protein
MIYIYVIMYVYTYCIWYMILYIYIYNGIFMGSIWNFQVEITMQMEILKYLANPDCLLWSLLQGSSMRIHNLWHGTCWCWTVLWMFIQSLHLGEVHHFGRCFWHISIIRQSQLYILPHCAEAVYLPEWVGIVGGNPLFFIIKRTIRNTWYNYPLVN